MMSLPTVRRPPNGLFELAAAVLMVLLAVRPVAGHDESAAEPDPVDAGQSDAVPRAFRGSVEVVATRVFSEAAEAGRREVVVTRDEIAALPVNSVQELLAVIPGTGLARRGARGVQADLNLRGSTFEQALVMVNGLRVNNPQTGHHSLDLFVPLAAVERVEILLGSGSALHGPDAFGGAINIVTSSPTPTGWARIGQNDLGGLGFGLPVGGGVWVSGERESHDGFRPGTEAAVNQFAGGWSWAGDRSSVDVMVAVGDRDFGAYRFYSSRFPDQREATSGDLVTANAGFTAGALRWTAALRLDRHEDDFVLDRERPDWYRNQHRTQGTLVDLGLTGTTGGWRWAAGVEGARETIESSNLGDHGRSRGALYGEAGRTTGPVSFTLQGRADRYRDWGTVPTWGAGGAFAVAQQWRLRAYACSSFRAPSFTDLYYTSPSTVGDPELEPEHGLTFELGLDHGPFTASIFRRSVSDLIDYVLDDDEVWRADNIGGVTTSGVEAAVDLPVAGRLLWQRAGAVWLTSDVEVDPERSAYALAHPRFELQWSGAVNVGRGWSAGWVARFRQPVDGGSWAVLDCRVGRRILGDVSVFLEAANLFDREITELHDVPLPGRWVSLTVGYRAGGW